MTEAQQENFFERTLANLAGAWRDIAAGAARSVGLDGAATAARDARALEKLMAADVKALVRQVERRTGR